jgi:hypothetical protein
VTDKDSSDTKINSGTDTEDLESFMPNFITLIVEVSGQMVLR